jgi:uncharacterized protein (TIGR00297 family)
MCCIRLILFCRVFSFILFSCRSGLATSSVNNLLVAFATSLAATSSSRHPHLDLAIIALHYISLHYIAFHTDTMKPFGVTATCLGASIATLAVMRGLKKKTLSRSGAVSAWCVGFLMVGSGLRGFVLLMFYQIGSSATKYKKEWKESHDATAAEGSVRGPSQVLGCSALAVILSLVHVLKVGEEQRIDFHDNYLAASLTCAILAHHATCLADTMASELGMLTKTTPVLITQPWRTVPGGTNGGVTVFGTCMSAVGGALMGLGTACMDWCSGGFAVAPPAVPTLQLVVFGTVCGFVGSVIDSVLGATVQATYQNPEDRVIHHERTQANFKHIAGMDLLTNVQVNLVSICITSALGGCVFGQWIFQSY